jgi:hypothetical protein
VKAVIKGTCGGGGGTYSCLCASLIKHYTAKTYGGMNV